MKETSDNTSQDIPFIDFSQHYDIKETKVVEHEDVNKSELFDSISNGATQGGLPCLSYVYGGGVPPNFHIGPLYVPTPGTGPLPFPGGYPVNQIYMWIQKSDGFWYPYNSNGNQIGPGWVGVGINPPNTNCVFNLGMWHSYIRADIREFPRDIEYVSLDFGGDMGFEFEPEGEDEEPDWEPEDGSGGGGSGTGGGKGGSGGGRGKGGIYPGMMGPDFYDPSSPNFNPGGGWWGGAGPPSK